MKLYQIHLRIPVYKSSNFKLNSELKESESLNRGHFFARSGDRQQASCRSSTQSHNLFKLKWVEINSEVHFVSNKESPLLGLLRGVSSNLFQCTPWFRIKLDLIYSFSGELDW